MGQQGSLIHPRDKIGPGGPAPIGQEQAVHLAAADNPGAIGRESEQPLDLLFGGFQHRGGTHLTIGRWPVRHKWRERHPFDMANREAGGVQESRLNEGPAEINGDETHWGRQ